MPLVIRRTSAVAAAVDVVALKEHIRVDGEYDNEKLKALAQAVQDVIESASGIAMAAGTYEQSWDRLPAGCILRPARSPLISVTSLEVIDESGTFQPVPAGDIQTDSGSKPGRVYPTPGATWPTPGTGFLGGVRLTFEAGWTTGTPAVNATPEHAKLAVLMMTESAYELRGQYSDVNVGAAVRANPIFDSMIASFAVPEVY